MEFYCSALFRVTRLDRCLAGSEFAMASGAFFESLGAVVAGEAAVPFLVVVPGDQTLFLCGKQLHGTVVADETSAGMSSAVKHHLAFAAAPVTQGLSFVGGPNLTACKAPPKANGRNPGPGSFQLPMSTRRAYRAKNKPTAKKKTAAMRSYELCVLCMRSVSVQADMLQRKKGFRCSALSRGSSNAVISS
jgi:hypothetical protein